MNTENIYKLGDAVYCLMSKTFESADSAFSIISDLHIKKGIITDLEEIEGGDILVDIRMDSGRSYLGVPQKNVFSNFREIFDFLRQKSFQITYEAI